MTDFTVDDFVRVESASGPSFSPDGRAIIFRSNRTGTPQAFVVSADGEDAAPARRVAETEGVIYDTWWRPGHDDVLFVADDGGDEQYQIHLVGAAEGSASRPLAAAPGVIHSVGAWSADGRLLSYSSNRRDRRFFDIHVLDVEAGEERLVMQHDGMNGARRFDATASALLVSRPKLEHAGDNDLYLVDLVGDAPPRLLTEHDGIAQWNFATFHPAGAVLALTDDGRDFSALQRIDLVSGKREFLLKRDWDLEELALGPAGDRLAIVVNEDGYSRVEVYAVDADGRLGAPMALPALPPGIVSTVRWRADGGALACTLERSSAPADVWVLDLDTGTARQITHSDMHGIPADALPEPELIHYPTFDGREIPAFLYRPARPITDGTEDGLLPCMVLVHGGPESQSRPALWGRYAGPAYLLATGRAALLVPNVRGSTGYGKAYAHADDVELRMDSVRDLVAATDWLAGSGVVDPARIGVMGGSYGGFMTLAAITEAPDRWAAAVDLFGIANFVTFLEHTGPWRRKHRAAEYGDDPAFLETISPIHKADRIRTPLLVIQGDHDVRVPPEESEQIVDTVRRNEGVVEHIVFEREGHGIQRLPNRLTMAHRVVAFLDRHLVARRPA